MDASGIRYRLKELERIIFFQNQLLEDYQLLVDEGNKIQKELFQKLRISRELNEEITCKATSRCF